MPIRPSLTGQLFEAARTQLHPATPAQKRHLQSKADVLMSITEA